MKIELRFEDEPRSQCEICERTRPEVGAVAVLKTPNGHTLPLTDFVICEVCVKKLVIVLERSRIDGAGDPRAPPPPASAGGGGS